MLTKTFRAILIAGAATAILATACTKSGEAPTDVAPVFLEIPPAGQLPDQVSPTAYRLDVIADPAADTFSAIVEIDLKLDAAHKRIWLHSQDQVIESAFARLQDEQEIAAVFTPSEAEGGVSSFDFETPLPAGTATLIIAYSSPYNANLAGLYKASQNGRPYLATQMEPISARRMVPSFDEPRFKTPWTLTVTAPQGNQVIANGALQASTMLDNGLVQHQFATTRSIQSYLLALAIGPYDLRDGGALPANGIRPTAVPFRGFAPAGKGDQLITAMAATDAMVSWQEAYFDYPYPYGKLDIAAVPDFAAGAMENAGAIFYREGALLINDRTSFSRQRRILTTHAHELSHQWFGNLVTPEWWNDIWLNEAFATWMSYKTMDAIYPETGFDLAPQRAAIGVMGADSLISARQIRNPIERNADIGDAFDGITYRKGGGVLSMFETYLGQDAFRAGIRLHMRRHEDGVANVNDFMASLADGSGDPSVVDSFKSFIFQPGIPNLSVTLTCPTPETGLLAIGQSRYKPLGSEIEADASTWTIPFAARIGIGDDTHIMRQMLTGETAEIAINEGCPDWIIPNAGGTGYWRFNLDDASWQSLITAYDQLSPGEQLVFADSSVAAFAAGTISANTLLDALEANAHGDWGAAANPLNQLESYMQALPDEASKSALRDYVMEIYGARYSALSQPTDDAISAGDLLLRTSLFTTLLEIGRLDDDRQALAAAAAAYVGQNGAPDPSALPPADLVAAIGIAAQDSGADFYQAALSFARTTENQRERRTILSALARKLSEVDMLDLLANVQSDDFQGQETWSVSLSALRNQTSQAAAWQVFKANFDNIIARAPETRVPQTVVAVRAFCTPAGIDEAVAFFAANANLIPGHERNLAQATEAARLCATFRAEKGAELAEALIAR